MLLQKSTEIPEKAPYVPRKKSDNKRNTVK